MKVAELQIKNNALKIKPDQVGLNRQKPGKTNPGNLTAPQRSFSDILTEKIKDGQELRFSAHAVKRLNQRDIHMSKTELNRLMEGVNRVESKGADSSLILVDDMAYIVSVKNKIVVTALDKNSTMGNVFTNIDSVAIV